MNAKPYPKYKPSGVEFVGEVPEHWDVKRLRRVLATSLQYGANEAAELDDPELPRYVRITDVHENGSLRDETFRSLPTEIAKPYLLKDGDLLFARSGATAGKTFLYNESWGVCAYAGYLIRARLEKTKAAPAFVKYFTASSSYWQWLSSIYVQATIQNVSAEKYSDLKLPLPPLPEQSAISAFLDERTAKLDGLLEKKRTLIGKLKEKRSTLISRTVTKGLPPEAAAQAGLAPNPKLKSSGVPWLGDIPKHWPLKRLSEICKFDSGKAHEPFIDEDGEHVCVNARFVSTSGITRKFCSENFCPAEKDDILMVMSDLPNGRALAKAYLVGQDEKLAVNQRVCRLRTFGDDPKFLFYSLDRNPGLLRFNDGVSQTHLSNANYKKLDLPMPALNEQTYIVAYLDTETAKIDCMIEKVETAIEKLTEYRTALITAAVTGKIDVRHR